jgi:DNA-binding winged helix-turn-helix (wHTH) protein
VENTVFQIRRRLRPHAGGHDFIRTVAGLGYQFNPG